MAGIIQRNTTVSNLQKDVFFFDSSISGTVFSDANGNGRMEGREQGAATVEVRLIDATSDEVIATTLTDSRGRYEFGVEEGLRTGVYKVGVALPDGSLGPMSAPLAITRGSQFLEGTDIALAGPSRPGPHNPRGPQDHQGPMGPTGPNSKDGHRGVDLAMVGTPHGAPASPGANHRDAGHTQGPRPSGGQLGHQATPRRHDEHFVAGVFQKLMSELC